MDSVVQLVVGAGISIMVWWWLWWRPLRRIATAHVPCPSCGASTYPDAAVCVHCHRDIGIGDEALDAQCEFCDSPATTSCPGDSGGMGRPDTIHLCAECDRLWRLGGEMPSRTFPDGGGSREGSR